MKPKPIGLILALVFVFGLVLAVTPAAMASSPIYVRPGGDDANCNGTADLDYPGSGGPDLSCAVATIQAGVGLVDAGGTVYVRAGTYVLTTVVKVNKAGITLDGDGAGATIVQVSGTGDRIDITAASVTLQDFEIEKTDKTGEQNIVRLTNGNNVTIKNNIIHGQFVIGDEQVSRALVINAGAFSGLNIESNTIYGLRQPAYVSGTHTGTVQNNFVYGTKGWVLEGGDLTFTGNTWGTGADVNVYDIAIISAMPAAYYTDIVAMSNANNGAVIEDQRVSPAVLSVVYVDAATAYSSDLGGRYHPYSSISPAVTRVVAGGTIHVAAGTYVEQVVVDAKNVTVEGEGAATVIQAPDVVPTCFVVSGADRKPVVCAKNGASLFLKALTVDGAGKGNSNNRFFGVAFRNAGGEISNVIVQDVRDTPFSGAQHGVGVYSFNDDAVGRTIKLLNSTIVGFQKNGTAFIAGDTTPLVLEIQGNTITGAGTTTVTAQNGIQTQGRLVTGSVTGNSVTGIAYDGDGWVATGILDYYSALDIKNNTLTGCHTCIYKIEASGEISGNMLTVIEAGGYAYGIVASDPPGAPPSPHAEGAVDSEDMASAAATRPTSTLAVSVDDNIVTFSGADNASSYGIEIDSGYSPDNIAFTATGNTVSGFAVGVEVYQCQSNCKTGVLSEVSVNLNSLAGNTIGLRSNVNYLTVDGKSNWWGDVSGPGSVGPGAGSNVSTNVDYEPWCNDDFSNCTYTTGTISMQTSGTPAEVGDIVTMDSLVTGGNIYGMQLRVSFDATALQFQAAGSLHNDVSATGWYWDTVPENFVAVSGGRRLSGSMSAHQNSAALTGESVATWKFKCLKPGIFDLTYDATIGTGTYLATKDGFNIPADLVNAQVTCLAATAAVDGYITLQGRLATNPLPAAWQDAVVTLTCVPSTGCDGFGPYTMTTDAGGHYQHLKIATPGSGVVLGRYSAAVERRAHLGAAKTTNVVVVSGSNTINTLATAPRLLGGDVVGPAGVSIADLTSIGGAFGSSVIPDTGNDVNGDGFVNIFDLVLAGGNLDKTTSPWLP